MSETGNPRRQQSNGSALKSTILEWVERLSAHFNAAQDEEQIKIFLHALRNCTVYQVEQAFERCLNECEFMPRLSQVHARIPEQKYPTENPGRFRLCGRPILDMVREIAKELHPDYDSITDAERIKQISAEANRERYRRMGRVVKW